MIETIAILLDLPMADALQFAGTMLLTIALSYVIVCGTSRGRK